jgi:hypothetical protein
MTHRLSDSQALRAVTGEPVNYIVDCLALDAVTHLLGFINNLSFAKLVAQTRSKSPVPPGLGIWDQFHRTDCRVCRPYRDSTQPFIAFDI